MTDARVSAMDLDAAAAAAAEEEQPGGTCSICLDLVLGGAHRSTARLLCGHSFHLDCIGSAFNAKGMMQCPNCRKVEKGRWLYASGHCSPAEFDLDGWVTEEIYDLSYPELPFGFQWSPVRGFTQLASLFEEGEPQRNSYHELMGTSTMGDHSTAPSSAHMCPFLALHRLPPVMHTAPSATADAVPNSGPFQRHSSGLEGQASADMSGTHSFLATDSHHHNWQQQPSIPFPASGNSGPPPVHGLRLPLHETSNHQRLGSFVPSHPLLHGSIPPTGGILAASIGPAVMGEVRAHNRLHGTRIYPQSVSSASLRSSAFHPLRRPRSRGLALVSSVASTSSAELSSFYGISVSGSVNSNLQDGENISRRFDRFYGWGRDRYAPLPWIPLEGESQWWGPFSPNQNPQSRSTNPPTRNFFPQRPTERVGQSRPENGYQHIPPSRVPPFM